MKTGLASALIVFLLACVNSTEPESIWIKLNVVDAEQNALGTEANKADTGIRYLEFRNKGGHYLKYGVEF